VTAFDLTGKKAFITGASRGIGRVIAVGAAKAAVIAVTKTLAVAWAPSGIRVNALCPGWTATDLNQHMWGGPDGGRAVIASVPMGRWGQPG